MTATASLGRSTAVMAAGTLLSRLTGFGRVLALAYVLGFERLTDTYNLANTTPNIVYELVLGGILSATLVPVFVGAARLRPAGDDRPGDGEEGDPSDDGAVDAIVTLAAVALLAITALFALAAPLIIALYTVGNDSGSVADQRAVATTLLRLFAPQVALYGMVTITTALLQARRRFAVPMFAPVLNNVIVITVILLLPRDLTLEGIRTDRNLLLLLGLGTTAGVALQAVAQLIAAARAGHRFRLVWRPGHPAVRKVLGLSGWTVGFVIANQVALYVILVLANRQRGGVSAYQAAQMFFVLPHAIFAVSVISALLPDLSARWADRDVDGFRSQLSLGIRVTALVLVPAAIGYLLLSGPIVEVVLQHGALRSSDAATTGRVLAAFAAGLPGFSLFLLLTRAFQAMTDTRTVFWLYVLENGLNVAFALALFPAFGVVGLAASYGIAYSIAAVVGGLVLRRRTSGLDEAALVRSALRIALAATVMAVAVSGMRWYTEGWTSLATVSVGVGVGAATFLVTARAVRVPELGTLLSLRKAQ